MTMRAPVVLSGRRLEGAERYGTMPSTEFVRPGVRA